MLKPLLGNSVHLLTIDGGFHGEALAVGDLVKNMAPQERTRTAVLFRTNAQSALLEQQLIRQQIPYVVRGGAAFFARKEIYQMVFFLAAAYCNSLEAVIGYPRSDKTGGTVLTGIGNFPTISFNKPSRYLGTASFNKLELLFKTTPKADLVKVTREFEDALDRRFKPGARDLADMLEQLREQVDNSRDALMWAFDQVYENQLRLDTDNNEDAYNNKVASIMVLMEMAEQTPDIQEFVAYCLGRLFSSLDTSQESSGEAIQLMTIHAAKGLEFQTVFILGVNDRYLPHARGDLNEERRIFYVAVTRAEEQLILSAPIGLDFYGKDLLPSCFLEESFESDQERY